MLFIISPLKGNRCCLLRSHQPVAGRLRLLVGGWPRDHLWVFNYEIASIALAQ